MLVLLNIAFLGCVMWFMDSQIERRTVLADKIITHCLAKTP